MSLLSVNSMYVGLSLTPETTTMIINLPISIGAALALLFTGLFFRRLLVRRLKKTILDNWIIQTLGALVIVVALLLGIVSGLAIWNTNLLGQFLHIFGTNITDVIATWLISLFWTITTIALGIGVARTINTLTIRGLGENHIDINMRTLIGRIFYITILIITSFLVLYIWRISIDVPVAVLGAIAVASTVAFQDILKNLVAGFYLLLERPFYIGDQIDITTGTTTFIGKVEGIQLRTTRLRLTSGEEVAIPNMLIFGNAVVNNTFYGERRAMIAMTLPQEEFIPEQTQELLLKTLQEFEVVITKPEPQVIVSGYADKKIMLTVRFWIAGGHNIDISHVAYKLHEVAPTADLSVKEPPGSV